MGSAEVGNDKGKNTIELLVRAVMCLCEEWKQESELPHLIMVVVDVTKALLKRVLTEKLNAVCW